MENATNRVTMMLLPKETAWDSTSQLFPELLRKANKQFKELEEKDFRVIYNQVMDSSTLTIVLSFWTSLSSNEKVSGDFFTKELKQLIEEVEKIMNSRKQDTPKITRTNYFDEIANCEIINYSVDKDNENSIVAPTNEWQ